MIMKKENLTPWIDHRAKLYKINLKKGFDIILALFYFKKL